jgi:plastocyanin
MKAHSITSIGFVLLATAAGLTLGACSSDDSTERGSGGSSGTGGSSSGTGGSTGSTMINGCDSATAEDHTSDTNVDVTFPNTQSEQDAPTYKPACVKIKAGSTVTFKGDFTAHPLTGGEHKGLMAEEDTSSPIKNGTGMSTTITFSTAGTFPYYCGYHYLANMEGAVFVE